MEAPSVNLGAFLFYISLSFDSAQGDIVDGFFVSLFFNHGASAMLTEVSRRAQRVATFK
jgi:hypothetical protein